MKPQLLFPFFSPISWGLPGLCCLLLGCGKSVRNNGAPAPRTLNLQARALRPLGVPEVLGGFFLGGGCEGRGGGAARWCRRPPAARGRDAEARRERRRGARAARRPKMAQTVNVAELSLPQLEVLKNQLDQVGRGGGGCGGASGGERGVTGEWGRAGLGRVRGRVGRGCGAAGGRGAWGGEMNGAWL